MSLRFWKLVCRAEDVLRACRDRWTCWLKGPLDSDDQVAAKFVAALIETTSRQEEEIGTLKAALAECMKAKSLAEENATRCDVDLRDVLFLRGGMHQHPSFGGDQ